MTALAGLWRYDGSPDIDSGCARMLAAQALYGPDSVSQWSGDDVALGRQLKLLLPEDVFDAQPLHGGGGRYAIVADIRLDNREELAGLLGISPREASLLCDTAILLAAFERWGDHCVERLIGDFAFLLWDRGEHRLILARDPLGQRPLFYHSGKNMFAAASMPKGLHALPSIPYELDEESFFSAIAEDTRTVYRNIEKVLPGHIVSVTRRSVRVRRYWQPRVRQLKLRNAEEYSAALRDVLDEAVKCRLRGADRVGAYLSGGLDSSAVAATAARQLSASGGKVIAFTAVPREGYDGPVPPNRFADEGAHAAATAALYSNMDHVLVRSEGKSPLDLLDRNFFLFDGYSSNLSNFPWTDEILNRAQARDLKILLDGSLGNLGLSYDGMGLLPELFKKGRWFWWSREAYALLAQRKLRWRGVLVKTLGPWCPIPIWLWVHRAFSRTNIDPSNYTPINPTLLKELVSRRTSNGGGRDLFRRPNKDGLTGRLSAIQRQDTGVSNKGFLGGYGIDCRDPTSDIRLLEFCLSVPTDQFLKNGVQRALARRALSDRLPKLVLEETRRGLQTADWHERLCADRERFKAEIERLDSCPAAARLLNLPHMHELLEKWPNDWSSPEVISSYRGALMQVVSIGHFVRRVTGSNA